MKAVGKLSSAAFVIAVLVAAAGGPAQSQSPAPTNGSPAMGTAMPQAMQMATPASNANPSTQAFKAADEKMMKDMNRPMSGNADQDFVAGMLPHHQGAVDMANVELQFGKDPEMRKLARGIITAQKKEIALMQAWQKKHSPRP